MNTQNEFNDYGFTVKLTPHEFALTFASCRMVLQGLTIGSNSHEMLLELITKLDTIEPTKIKEL